MNLKLVVLAMTSCLTGVSLAAGTESVIYTCPNQIAVPPAPSCTPPSKPFMPTADIHSMIIGSNGYNLAINGNASYRCPVPGKPAQAVPNDTFKLDFVLLDAQSSSMHCLYPVSQSKNYFGLVARTSGIATFSASSAYNCTFVNISQCNGQKDISKCQTPAKFNALRGKGGLTTGCNLVANNTASCAISCVKKTPAK